MLKRNRLACLLTAGALAITLWTFQPKTPTQPDFSNQRATRPGTSHIVHSDFQPLSTPPAPIKLEHQASKKATQPTSTDPVTPPPMRPRKTRHASWPRNGYRGNHLAAFARPNLPLATPNQANEHSSIHSTERTP